MKFDPGILAVGIAILLFYARLAQIRGRKRKLARQEEAARIRSKTKKKKEEEPKIPRPNYEVGNYYLLVLGVVLMLGGLAMYTFSFLPQYREYWWVAATVGMVAFIFCVK